MSSISYDIVSCPRGMDIDQLVHLFKEESILLYDSRLGKKPEFLSDIIDPNITIKDITFGIPGKKVAGDTPKQTRGRIREYYRNNCNVGLIEENGNRDKESKSQGDTSGSGHDDSGLDFKTLQDGLQKIFFGTQQEVLETPPDFEGRETETYTSE